MLLSLPRATHRPELLLGRESYASNQHDCANPAARLRPPPASFAAAVSTARLVRSCPLSTALNTRPRPTNLLCARMCHGFTILPAVYESTLPRNLRARSASDCPRMGVPPPRWTTA